MHSDIVCVNTLVMLLYFKKRANLLQYIKSASLVKKAKNSNNIVLRVKYGMIPLSTDWWALMLLCYLCYRQHRVNRSWSPLLDKLCDDTLINLTEICMFYRLVFILVNTAQHMNQYHFFFIITATLISRCVVWFNNAASCKLNKFKCVSDVMMSVMHFFPPTI